MKLLTRYISLSILSASLIGIQQSAAADVMEEETNHPVSLAQFVTPGMNGFELAGVLGNLTGTAVEDVDFYRFFGQAGDVVTLDVDFGIGGQRSVDTVLAIFGDAPGFRMLRMNDDSYPLDTGSNSTYDSRITNFVLPSTGVYYVGVSHYPRYFRDGGVTLSGAAANGDYHLVISGVSESMLHINIAIKPGSDEVAPLNPKARGRVPVALLSSAGFDPKDVDVKSLTFGHDGNEPSLEKCSKPETDLNGDGAKDMVCHFDNQMSEFRKGDIEGVLKGAMKDGTMLEGRGLLKVVPEKAH
ncbi:MAG: PPC domain-containing protein [Gammaproteobacteria bacterium]|nr:PPC domain-containing protein [Gammaproteobacteria bacterium]